MDELLKKYAQDELNNDELQELRNVINASTDHELQFPLENIWLQEKGENISTDILASLKNEIDKQTDLQPVVSKPDAWKIVFRVSAVVFLPLLVLFSYLFYQNSISTVYPSNMIITVGAGEKTNVVLPDGTKVELNSETVLSYDAAGFNKKIREVELNGEAYFEVAKNEKNPFIISTSHLKVHVLGTVFNLSARDENDIIELNLLKGKININSYNTDNDEVMLYTNQRAVFSKATGKMDVYKADVKNSTAWKRGEIVFKATPLNKVLREIERNYGVTINADVEKDIMNDEFTGTFSTKKLDEVMSVLKIHYRFDYWIHGDQVRITKK